MPTAYLPEQLRHGQRIVPPAAGWLFGARLHWHMLMYYNHSATKAQRHKGALEQQSENNDFESLTLLFLLRVFCGTYS